MELKFDTIVIGAGPAGVSAAIHSSSLGKKTAIIDKLPVGGNCLWSGTFPSKSLSFNSARGLSFSASIKHLQHANACEHKKIKAELMNCGVSIYRGTASFTGRQSLKVTSGTQVREFQSSLFVVSPGSRPNSISDFPIDKKKIHDSNSILSLRSPPDSLLILGAGVIGCEYASIFSKFGTQVTLVDRRKDLLRSIDLDIVHELLKIYKKSKVKVELGCLIEPEREQKKGSVSIRINGRKRSFSQILICMGRVPNVEMLNLEAAGVKLNERGFISVMGKKFETSNSAIFAVGDVIGAPGLAATALAQGRSVPWDANQPQNQELVYPSGIYTIPEISSVGITEAQAQEMKISYVTASASYLECSRALIQSDRVGCLKLIVKKSDLTLLGAHILGNIACEMIHLAQFVLQKGESIHWFNDRILNHPTYSELFGIVTRKILLKRDS